jgi:glutathione reductase (NADPH)
MNSRAFDLVVIGSGSAAGTVASRARAAGWTVAMVDQQPFGGTCALRGCDPKKVLVGAAAALDAARNLAGKGIEPRGLAIDWPALMTFKRTFTEPYPAHRAARLRSQGIELFQGTARFAGRSFVTVGGETLEARRGIVIAAGARPAPLPIAGADLVTTSDGFLDLPELPRSIAFIGGGYISFEFAHIAARAGAQVTIVHRGPRPLEQFEPELVDALVARTRRLGVDLRLDAEVSAVEPHQGGYRVTYTARGELATLDADLVVHGAGRVPDLADLDCKAGGVRCSARGVAVTPQLQSVSNPLVYAAGDCADSGGPPLTPVAGYEGRIVSANLVDAAGVAPDYSVVPSVVFTLPPLAAVGLTEARARAAGLRVRVNRGDTSSWYSSRRLGEEWSGFKTLVDEETGRVIGAHLLGPHADEVVNVFAVAMRAGLQAADLKQAIWAYPTNGSDFPYLL